MSLSHAADNDGYLAQAYQKNRRFRQWFFGRLNNDKGENFLRDGTTWTTMKKYGLTEEMAICPTNYNKMRVVSGRSRGWGTWTNIGYYLFTGIQTHKGVPGQYHLTSHKYSEIVPAIKITDRAPDSRGIASDYVLFHRFNGSRKSNHGWQSNLIPAWQGVLFGDGHVAPVYYHRPLSKSTGDASLWCTTRRKFAVFWEGN